MVVEARSTGPGTSTEKGSFARLDFGNLLCGKVTNHPTNAPAPCVWESSGQSNWKESRATRSLLPASGPGGLGMSGDVAGQSPTSDRHEVVHEGRRRTGCKEKAAE
jgi:hypothetical protein